MKFDEIILTKGEKQSLRSFLWKPKQSLNEIKHFHSLYYDYRFIKDNYLKERDEFNHPIPSGTYSLSDRYERFKIYRREKRLQSLPNWLAILISLISLIITTLMSLWQLGWI